MGGLFRISDKKQVEELVSAGGVVYRMKDSTVEVIVCGRESQSIWGLPKGTADANETREQTALREVNEETGLEVVLDEYIDSVEYWFGKTTNRTRCHKTVYFYLMQATGGDFTLHDHEFDYVRWLSVDEARKTLTYENEVKIVEDALSLVWKKARTG